MTKRQKIPQQFYKKNLFLKSYFFLTKRNVCNDKRKKMPQQFDKKN